MKRIVLLGGSGFIGSVVAERLAARGDSVVIPTRILERAREVAMLPTVEVRLANIRHAESLRACLAGADAVVNLVGILHPERSTGFDGAHVDLPREVARTCVSLGIPTLVHMSALNADPAGPSEYLRSRGRGELAVREAIGKAPVALSIIRPSVVFGQRDSFLNMLAGLVRKFPVIPLGSPSAKFQPVHVGDVADVIVACIDHPELAGAPLCLAGPTVYSMRELVQFVAETLGKCRLIIPLPHALAMLQALAFEYPPGKWLGAALGVALTRDNVRSMSIPSVSDTPLPSSLNWKPAALEPIASDYLNCRTHRTKLQSFRECAARTVPPRM